MVDVGESERFGFNEADWQLLSLAHRFQVLFIVDWLVKPDQELSVEYLAQRLLLADSLHLPELKVRFCPWLSSSVMIPYSRAARVPGLREGSLRSFAISTGAHLLTVRKRA